jgi:DNA-binding FadR family transcriptional regulator
MQPGSLARVNRVPLYHSVALGIHDFILANNLAPGSVLPAERALMLKLGVSRASLREGLRVLQALGIIQTMPGAGPVVHEPDLNLAVHLAFSGLSAKQEQLLNLCEVRELLEVRAAELAASRITPQELEAIDAVLRRMEARVQRGERPPEEDVEFHKLIFIASRNTVLEALLKPIGNLLLTARREGWLDPTEALAEHKGVYAALASHDRVGAGTAMRRHVRHSTEVFLRKFAHEKG